MKSFVLSFLVLSLTITANAAAVRVITEQPQKSSPDWVRPIDVRSSEVPTAPSSLDDYTILHGVKWGLKYQGDKNQFLDLFFSSKEWEVTSAFQTGPQVVTLKVRKDPGGETKTVPLNLGKDMNIERIWTYPGTEMDKLAVDMNAAYRLEKVRTRMLYERLPPWLSDVTVQMGNFWGVLE